MHRIGATSPLFISAGFHCATLSNTLATLLELIASFTSSAKKILAVLQLESSLVHVHGSAVTDTRGCDSDLPVSCWRKCRSSLETTAFSFTITFPSHSSQTIQGVSRQRAHLTTYNADTAMVVINYFLVAIVVTNMGAIAGVASASKHEPRVRRDSSWL